MLGAAMSLCTVALHGYWWGLVLGLLTTAATMVALPAGWWARLAFAGGWLGLVLLVTRERPEGDFVIAGDAYGYALLLAGMGVLGSAIVTLRPRREDDHATAGDSGTLGPST
jgi:hypothetical protein